MTLTDSLVVLLLLAASGVSMWLHYRAIAPAKAAPLGWPFAVGLASLLGIVGFLALTVIAPGWAERRPAFFALGLLLFAAALVLRRRASVPVKMAARPVPLGELPPELRQAIEARLRKPPPDTER